MGIIFDLLERGLGWSQSLSKDKGCKEIKTSGDENCPLPPQIASDSFLLFHQGALAGINTLPQCSPTTNTR